MKEIKETKENDEIRVSLMGSKGCGLVSLSYRFLNKIKPSKDQRMVDISFERDLKLEDGVTKSISLSVYIHEMDSIYQYCSSSEFFFLVYSPYSKSSFAQIEEYFKAVMQYNPDYSSAPTTPTSPTAASSVTSSTAATTATGESASTSSKTTTATTTTTATATAPLHSKSSSASLASSHHPFSHSHSHSHSHSSSPFSFNHSYQSQQQQQQHHHYHHQQPKICAIIANYTSKKGVYSSMSSLALEGSEIRLEDGQDLANRLGCLFFKIEDENPETIENAFISLLSQRKKQEDSISPVITLKKQSSLKKIINNIRRKSLAPEEKK